jgi:hypothetical protein
MDEYDKSMSSKSEMSDEDDRCKECGCLLTTDRDGDTRCKNMDCEKFNLIVRITKL